MEYRNFRFILFLSRETSFAGVTSLLLPCATQSVLQKGEDRRATLSPMSDSLSQLSSSERLSRKLDIAMAGECSLGIMGTEGIYKHAIVYLMLFLEEFDMFLFITSQV